MESRLERYLKEKEQKKKSRKKFIIILALIFILFFAIAVVNNSLGNYLELSDVHVFNYKFEESIHEIEVFGNKYKLEQDTIHNIYSTFKRPFINIKNYISDILK